MAFAGVLAPGLVASFADAGVDGLFSKSEPPDAMLERPPQILRGGKFVAPAFVEILEGTPDRLDLTPRERQTLNQVARGRSNKEIAAALGISVKTVEKHRESLMRKLDVSAVTHPLVKALFAVVSILIAAAYATHVAGLNRDVAAAQAVSLAAAQEAARNAEELLAAERNFARARDLAAAQQRRMAAASHDLMQPIAALRVALGALPPNSGADRTARAQAIGYLAEVARDELGRDDGPAADDLSADASGREAFDAQLLLDAAAAVLDGPSQARLRLVDSSARVSAPLAPALRVLSNWLSNAARHSDGAILLSLRRDGETHWIEIVDAGPGVAPEALARLRGRGAKGTRSSGRGLGLAIVDDLATEHGFKNDYRTTPGCGFRARLGLPAA